MKTDGGSDQSSTEDGSGKFGYKILASIGAALSANVARKMLSTGWKTATGNEPPANPENPDQRIGEAIGWAAISAGVIAAARVLAQRKVAATWRNASGVLPPGMESHSK
jgi:uncharacterized protein DUF4235